MRDNFIFTIRDSGRLMLLQQVNKLINRKLDASFVSPSIWRIFTVSFRISTTEFMKTVLIFTLYRDVLTIPIKVRYILPD